jgi:hypothetical protein
MGIERYDVSKIYLGYTRLVNLRTVTKTFSYMKIQLFFKYFMASSNMAIMFYCHITD